MQDGNDGCAKSCEHFLRYLGFREYGRYLSFHFPFTHERSLLEHLRAAPFKFDQQHFKVSTLKQTSAAGKRSNAVLLNASKLCPWQQKDRPDPGRPGAYSISMSLCQCFLELDLVQVVQQLR